MPKDHHPDPAQDPTEAQEAPQAPEPTNDAPTGPRAAARAANAARRQKIAQHLDSDGNLTIGPEQKAYHVSELWPEDAEAILKARAAHVEKQLELELELQAMASDPEKRKILEALLATPPPAA